MNVRPQKLATILTKPRILVPTVFMAVGTGKTMLDYEKAKPEKKRRIFAKDSAMLLGSLAGFLLMKAPAKWLCGKESNIPKNILQSTSYVIKQSVAGALSTLGGIVGAVCGNEVVHKFVLDKPYFNEKPKVEPQEETANKKTGKEDAKAKDSFDKFFAENKVFEKFNYANKHAAQTAGFFLSLPGVSNFSAPPMIALTGMSVAKMEGYNNKIKRTSKELIANCLIPSLLVSAVSLAVSKKTGYIKYPAILASLVAGSFAGTKLADLYQNKLDETIDSIDFQRITFKRNVKQSAD